MKLFFLRITYFSSLIKNMPLSFLFLLFATNLIVGQVPPIANDDIATTIQNTPLNSSAPGLLENDTHGAGDVIIITEFLINGTTYIAGQTANFAEGDITIFEDGSYTFTPAGNYIGEVSIINYTITDGSLISSANLIISILSIPVPPNANDFYDTVDVNTTLNVSSPGVFVNDTDENGDELFVTEFVINGVTYAPGQTAVLSEGSITIASDGSYIFIPTPNYIGTVPNILYTITDGVFTSSAWLFLTVEPTEDLLEIISFSSCNQGYTANGEYKVRYSAVFRNRSKAKDFHDPSFIRNIDIRNNLQTTFGNDCVTLVDGINVYNGPDRIDFNTEISYPVEFDGDAINPNFATVTSTSVFNDSAINNLILYPRQDFTVIFCVTVDPFCNGRPEPTPSGSGIDFNNIINVTSNKGNASKELLLTDFHTTEAVVTAGLYVPEFNDSLDPPGVINPDGTFDYTNTVIITNEGTAAANNVNFNMGLGNFIDQGVVFDQLNIVKVSGPDVAINQAYNGNTETSLLSPNNSLQSGEKLVLEIFYLTQPIRSSLSSVFNQNPFSQTQGVLDGFDESLDAIKRRHSFVTWSDNLGDHLDRYYKTTNPTNSVSSSLQCVCSTASMSFFYESSSNMNKVISNVNKVPNGILEHEEITFQITIENTSESVELKNLQIQDNLNNICPGEIVSVTTPIIQNSTANTNPQLNANYDGISEINLFDGLSGILGANETITVQFSVVFNETCIRNNVAVFTSNDPFNVLLSSSSFVEVNAFSDTDNDGIFNDKDLDDDNDTILDVLEYNGLNPLDDHDADLIPNYRDLNFGPDANGDGIVDLFDFDSDGVPNHFDLDSDNDGILDIVEAGNAALDANNNGRTNNAVGLNGLDDTIETNDTNNALLTYTVPNTDSNGNANYLDIDADGDGIVDNIEGQSTDSYITISNIFSEAGIDTAYPNGISPIDSENDGIFDYIDTNSDNDIRDDIIEGWDIDSDGTAEILPSNIDQDNDGLDDAFDTNDNLVNPTNGQVPTSFPNADNIDNPERDWREIIAIEVIITNVSEIEGRDFIFKLTFVTKNDNSILIESASDIDINFSTSNGTDATDIYDVATSPYDYNSITNTILTIPAFNNTSTFTVTSLDDAIFELDEFFTLTGVIISNNTLNTEVKGVGTILDDDLAPAITMNNSRENEGVDLVHTITISHPCSTPILIDIKTEDNLAVSPDDYIAILENLTIEGTVDQNNANMEVSFNIVTIMDNLNELDEETLNVTGAVSTNNVGFQDLMKTGTIIDIDPYPLVHIDDVKAEEGNSLEFTISLLNANFELMQNYLPIKFSLETFGNTAIADEDYESIINFTNIPAYTSSINQSIQTIDDRLNEDTEAFFLEVNITTNNTSNTFSPRGEGLITDNDYPNLFSPNFDGKSDLFKISGIEDYPNFKLTIFNRLGNEVFNYSNNARVNPLWWNGNHKGKPVPVGVYFYTLDFNDGVTKPRTSFIQLIR